MRLFAASAAAFLICLVSWAGPDGRSAAAGISADGTRTAQRSGAAKPAKRRVLHVGPTRALRTPGAAAEVARNGDHVKIDPGTYRDCAVWRASDLFLEGIGKRRPRMTSVVCDDQAIWLVRGNNVRVINIEFSRAHSSAFNGAGIKMVGINLLVRNSRFVGNENGILTADQPHSHIIVVDSRFERNGSCRKECAHGIYAGRVYRLVVNNSKFLGQRRGHHIKSRAYTTQLTGNTISDGDDGTASMSIDLPNGGNVDVAYNTIEQGPKAENFKTMISIGEETRPAKGRGHPMRNPSRGLVFRDNVFINHHPKGGVFIRNLTETPITLRNNRFIGLGKDVDGLVLGRAMPRRRR